MAGGVLGKMQRGKGRSEAVWQLQCGGVQGRHSQDLAVGHRAHHCVVFPKDVPADRFVNHFKSRTLACFLFSLNLHSSSKACKMVVGQSRKEERTAEHTA
jgi:hypothetical protein